MPKCRTLTNLEMPGPQGKPSSRSEIEKISIRPSNLKVRQTHGQDARAHWTLEIPARIQSQMTQIGSQNQPIYPDTAFKKGV